MAATLKTLEEIRSDQLREIKNLLPDADVGWDSDHYVRASGTASAVEGLYSYQQWQTRQIFPDTADPEYLLRHAAMYGMSLKSAVAAGGTLKVSGTVGTNVPSGLQFNIGALSYVTTSSSQISADGTAIVTCSATASGASYNITAPVTVQLMAVPSGVQSQATLLTMRGGLDVETYSQLLARLLDRLQNPPGGGKESDYRIWAMEVAGITAAYVFPHRVAVGRVDIAVVSGDGPASDDEIEAAQLNIDLKRPASCRAALVFSPDIVTIDHLIKAKLSGIAIDDLVTAITPQFAAYYNTLRPGDDLIKSRLESIVSDVRGVVDRQIVTPATNLTSIVDATRVQWFRMGAIAVEPM
ncbi:phage tail protein [Burkholderia multivorans]|uniref:baseplate J/gp47 family protein n=1 Tax=Burkholderia multivorans TaxID=87883 RepID=UPI000DABB13B|nr:baseplate J/gp47 family protein [Burkholderia multivorans]RAA31136.1 phage tail protein [Burkholderia multivorans]RAA32586.1 phage tail protein [Burkholderia multivorans]RAA37283.1 phage tail protein [Burkholderia multivorans]RAA38164.1 phage tail protein [Burkholderia multivorans]RAA41843.1 phage tail protein [Burkholderia multivorans]